MVIVIRGYGIDIDVVIEIGVLFFVFVEWWMDKVLSEWIDFLSNFFIYYGGVFF